MFTDVFLQVRDIKSMFHYEEIFLDIVVDLATSQARFKQSCEELLQGLLLPDSQFLDLVESLNGWEDRELETKLKHRLDEDFVVYKLKVKRLQRKVDLLRRKLRLGDDFEVGSPTTTS